MKRFREQKLNLERERKPFAPSTDAAEDKADTCEYSMDSSLERKKAEERVAVMKASSSAELLIQNAKAAWHDIIKTNASMFQGGLSIVATSEAKDATSEAKDVAAKGNVYNFSFPSKGNEGVTLPSFEYLKSQLEDMGKFSVEAELAASMPISESDIGADEAPKKTSLSSTKAVNKELLKLALDARQELVSIHANFELREQSLLSVTQCLEDAIRVSHLAFEKELADLRWKYRELRVRGGKRNTVLAHRSSFIPEEELPDTTTSTSAPTVAAEEELREEILAEFKAEQERVVAELEERVREQATTLGTLKEELRNVSQSSQLRIHASEEEAARCRARMDALQGEAEALKSDLAAVVEERDGLLQRERSRVAGDDGAETTAASFDSLYVRMGEHRKLEQVLRETKHQHETLLRAWEEQQLELAKARVEAEEATRAAQDDLHGRSVAPGAALQAAFISELQASLEEAKERISHLETTNRALQADVQKLSSGYVVVYPLLQSMSTRGAHEWTSEEKEQVSDWVGATVDVAVQQQEFRLKEMRYRYEAELLSAVLKKTRERLKLYTGIPLPGESEGPGGDSEAPPSGGDSSGSSSLVAQFETNWDDFLKQLETTDKSAGEVAIQQKRRLMNMARVEQEKAIQLNVQTARVYMHIYIYIYIFEDTFPRTYLFLEQICVEVCTL